MNAEDSYFLYVSVLFSRPRSILEIGHYLGKSTAAICEAINDGNPITHFDSYDIPYGSVEAFNKYYTSIHHVPIKATKSYSSILNKGKSFTQVVQGNLAELVYSKFVNLMSKDFRESLRKNYDLIFADVMHEEFEIKHNLEDIIHFGHKDSLFVFDDMNPKNISLIETISSLRLMRQTGKVGAFKLI